MDELGIIKKSSISKGNEAYNVYDAEKELVRPWKLDPIPFVLHQSEWEIIEKDLFREFTDLIYKDIYGEQLLIKK
jgi:uncharacterized circularly permuted ATP-grasp superfamily protein